MASEPKAKEPLIVILMVVILMVLLILTVVQFILFNFVEICKIWGSSWRWGWLSRGRFSWALLTKDRYFALKPPLIDRARLDLSIGGLIAFIRPLEPKIWRERWLLVGLGVSRLLCNNCCVRSDGRYYSSEGSIIISVDWGFQITIICFYPTTTTEDMMESMIGGLVWGMIWVGLRCTLEEGQNGKWRLSKGCTIISIDSAFRWAIVWINVESTSRDIGVDDTIGVVWGKFRWGSLEDWCGWSDDKWRLSEGCAIIYIEWAFRGAIGWIQWEDSCRVIGVDVNWDSSGGGDDGSSWFDVISRSGEVGGRVIIGEGCMQCE